MDGADDIALAEHHPPQTVRDGPIILADRGRLLDCVEDDLWSIKLPETAKPVVFKFLVNDLTWSVGPDYTVAPGSKAVFEPSF